MRSNGLPFELSGQSVHIVPVSDDCCSAAESGRPPFFHSNAHDRIDSKAFQDGWARLRTTENFRSLIERFGVTDFEALCLAGEIWATQVPVEAFVARLQLLAQLQLPCTFSLRHAGTMHNHIVVIDQVQCRKGCLHLLGDELCFILRKDCMDTVWVVTRPCAAGVLISLELYNKEHEPVVRLSGQSGHPAAAVWQDIIGTLPIMAACNGLSPSDIV